MAENSQEGDSEGDRRAQGTGVASSIKRRQWTVPMASMVTDHHLFARKSRAWIKVVQEENVGKSVEDQRREGRLLR